jgi:succinoglycan biosynthesis transport protein ExoP
MATVASNGNGSGQREVLLPDEIEISDQTRLDVRRMWAAVYRNRWPMIATIVLSLIIGLLMTIFTTPVYEATSTIQIEPRASQTLQNNTEVEPQLANSYDAQRYVVSAVDVIKSRALAEKVAEDLKLFTSNNFFEKMKLGDPSAEPGQLVGVSESRKRMVTNIVMGSLTVDTNENSSLVSLSISSPDPELAAEIANSYARNAVAYNLQQKSETTAYARKFLEDELRTAQARLERSERDAISYARAAGLLDLNITRAPETGANANNSTSASLVSGNLLSINTVLSEASAQRIAAQERFNSATKAPTLSLPEVQNNGTVQSLIRERALLAARYAEMGQRRQERFPEMVQIKAQIDSIDRQIAMIGKTVIDALRENLDYAQRRETKLRGQLNSLRSEALTEQERSVQYNLLRREADTNRQLYDMLLQRYREISTVAGVIAANIIMLDSAEVPGGPVEPQPLINMMVALAIGLGVAVALAYLRETFDDAVRAPEEIEEKLNTQFLGAIPKLGEEEDPFDQLEVRTSPLSESYLALRSVLSFSTSEGLPKVILCTSSLPGEGKSTTSYALARSFGAIGKKTLLLDGDLRKPTVHYLFDLPREPGFSEVIVGDKPIAEVVHHASTPNLDVLTCGTMPPNPAELFSGDHAAAAIDKLAEIYDVIIIDGPPVMGLADAPLLASIADGTLLIVEAGRGYRGQAKVAIRRLRANSARIIGAVLTKFDARQSGYGYAYEYNYSYTYKYGHDPKPKSFWPWSRSPK